MFIGCHGDKKNDTLATVHIGNHVMHCVDTVKDLDVHVDDNLKCITHINKTVVKAQSRANLIHKCFIAKDTATLKRAFTTYVRPILEYASSIWSPYLVGAVSKIESVQRTLTKRIRSMRGLSYVDRLSALVLGSLETRRLRLDLIYFYKILFGEVDIEWSNVFESAALSVTRGHCYKLFVKRVAVLLFVKQFFLTELLVFGTVCGQSLNSFAAYQPLQILSKTQTSPNGRQCCISKRVNFCMSTVLRMLLLCLTRFCIIIQRKLSTSIVLMLLLK
jgi:hypothetical protein